MNHIFDKYMDTLQKNPLFNGITTTNIPLLLNRLHASLKSYPKNSYIKYSGEPADFIGIVLTGEIHIIQDDYYGNRSIIASVIENELFGEAFACGNMKHLPVDIIAADDCTILFLNSNILLYSCDRNCVFHHKLINNLLNIIAIKNMLLNQKLTYTAHKTTKEKLLAYLNDMAKQNA
ncbi:MAG: Crp/Fnr family transcriptional regulator, partial [Lachnospiraceae bacterium]